MDVKVAISGLIIIIVIVAGIGYYATRPAEPSLASISSSPTSGNVADTITIAGTGFEANVTVSIKYDGTTVKTATADVDGDFQVSLSVPESAFGVHSITTDPASSTELFEVEKLKIAICLSGSLNDSGWNAAMYYAVREIEADLGLEVSIAEGLGVIDIDAALIDYAGKGNKIIIAHSFPFRDSVERVAPDYPNTWFLPTTVFNPICANEASFLFPGHEAAYLAGIIAGSISETGNIGVISGFRIPTSAAIYNNFKLGAQLVNPDINVLESYPGIWDDMTKGRETALAMIDTVGVDVILSRGDGLTLGVIQACALRDIYMIGDIIDQNQLAPNNIVTSCVWDLEVPLTNIVEMYRDGTLENKAYSWGLKDDGVYLASFHELEDIIPQSAKDLVNEIIENIKAGTFEIPYITT